MQGKDKDYYRQCDSCGAKFYGYDDCDMFVIDSKDYCRDCAVKSGYAHVSDYDGRIYVNNGIYRIAHTLSSMYDGPPEFFTTIDNVHGDIGKVVHKERDPMPFNWGYGLSGHIDEDHWEIYNDGSGIMFAYVVSPSKEEIRKLQFRIRGSK